MVELGQYDVDEWDAEVIGVDVIPLKDHLGERAGAFRAKMRKPDSQRAADWSEQDFEDYKDHKLAREVLVVKYKIGDMLRSEWVTIPLASGYMNSNLKKIRAKNEHLSRDTDDWVGGIIKVCLDKNGYYELSK